MGSRMSATGETTVQNYQEFRLKMATRAFANISNLPGTRKQAEDKRLSRASRKVLMVPQQKPTNTVLVSGKENRVHNLYNGQRKVRQTRVAASKLYSLEQEIPMEVEQQVYAPAVSDFVYITDNAYTEAEIKHMELRIIRALNFDLCQPIPLNFLRRYSKAGNVDVLQHSLAKYILE